MGLKELWEETVKGKDERKQIDLAKDSLTKT